MAMFTSTESRYSIRRGAMIAGLGTDAARRVDIDHEGRIRVHQRGYHMDHFHQHLDWMIEAAKAGGS